MATSQDYRDFLWFALSSEPNYTYMTEREKVQYYMQWEAAGLKRCRMPYAFWTHEWNKSKIRDWRVFGTTSAAAWEAAWEYFQEQQGEQQEGQQEEADKQEQQEQAQQQQQQQQEEADQQAQQEQARQQQQEQEQQAQFEALQPERINVLITPSRNEAKTPYVPGTTLRRRNLDNAAREASLTTEAVERLQKWRSLEESDGNLGQNLVDTVEDEGNRGQESSSRGRRRRRQGRRR